MFPMRSVHSFHACLALGFVLAGCSAGPEARAPSPSPSPSPSSIAAHAASAGVVVDPLAVIATDPAFGDWQNCLCCVREDLQCEVVGDAQAEARFERDHRRAADDAAAALARELVDPASAAAFAAFVASPAGRALGRAERRALTLGWFELDVPTGTLSRFLDRDAVGDAARRLLHEEISPNPSLDRPTSPGEIALVVAAAEITPEQADAIAAFHGTEVGARWIAVRAAAWRQSRARVFALRESAAHAGVVRPHLEKEPRLRW